MGFGLCDSWAQVTVLQEDTGQGANPGCERNGLANKGQRELPPLASEPLLPAWRRHPGMWAGDKWGNVWGEAAWGGDWERPQGLCLLTAELHHSRKHL